MKQFPQKTEGKKNSSKISTSILITVKYRHGFIQRDMCIQLACKHHENVELLLTLKKRVENNPKDTFLHQPAVAVYLLLLTFPCYFFFC